MALSAGSRLGPYEVIAPLGAGGRGEVYGRAGEGAQVGDRAPGPEARQRHADEVGGQTARLRPREGSSSLACRESGQGSGVDFPADDGERTADAGRNNPGDLSVHVPGAARGE